MRSVSRPHDDAFGMDADHRLRAAHGLGPAPDLDAARPPGTAAGEVVDDDRRPPVALDVAELLGLRQIEPADLDGVLVRVV